MPRKPFNLLCDIYKGPGTGTPGLFVGTFQGRYVVEDGIHAIGPGCPAIPAYLTIQGYQPQGAWTYPYFGVDSDLCDRVAIPSGISPNYFVLYTDIIIWGGQTPYFRAYLVNLPIPPIGPEGGIVFGGSAQVTTIPPFTSGGGILLGGTATVVFVPPLVAFGGILLGGSAIVNTIPPFITYGGLLLGGDTSASVSRMRIIQGSGGLLLGGSAVVVFTPGATDYWNDTFTDADGTALTAHTGEHTPGGYTAFLSTSMQINSNRCTIGTAVGGNCYGFFDNGHATYTMTANFLLRSLASDSGQRQFVYFFRYVDLSNYHYANFYYLPGDDSTMTWNIVKTVSGVPTTINAGSFSLASNTVRTLTFILGSTTINGNVDGNSFSGSDSVNNTVSTSFFGLLSTLTGVSGPYVDSLLLVP